MRKDTSHIQGLLALLGVRSHNKAFWVSVAPSSLLLLNELRLLISYST
jgi:hypothetical protein